MKQHLWEEFNRLKQELMLAKTEDEARRLNQRITVLLDILEDEEPGDEE